ncbi:uncharacterized protein LOC111110637 isoform X3 [Crassostrea virginica]
MSHYTPRIANVSDVGHSDRRERGHHEDEEGPGLQGTDPPAPQSYPGCFGLPYQDHNYGAPRPPTPPPTPPQPPQQMLMPPLAPLTPDKGHIEVEDVGSSAGLPITPPEVAPPKEADDDSVTRCICDFVHDDGYMICCDKCSVWQHIDCMGVDRNNIPDSYFCEMCEPRPLDREGARLIQLKKKEFLDTLTDSSATDTDPEEEANRQLSQQQQQQGGVDLMGAKKLKTKKQRNKSGNNNSNNGSRMSDLKQRKNNRKEKRDIKKEKENKDSNKKHQRVLNKDTTAGLKAKKMKLEKNKKPGLSLVINENTQQDPWDSSFSPWVDKYEEVYENLYSQDILNSFLARKINGVYPPENKGLGRKLRVQLCHVTEVNKNRKGLEATETIGEGEAVIEYTGEVMYKDQFNKDNFYKRLNPFVLFYSKYDDMDICIDATSYGNIARFIRRSCKANAEVRHVIQNGSMNFYVYSTKVIPRGSEITIPYDYNYKDCTYCVECACLRNNCPVAKFFKKRINLNIKKEKSPQKLPKLPVKSPIKTPIKSPIRKQPEELVPPENEAEVHSPLTESPEQVVSKEEPMEQLDNVSQSGDILEGAVKSEDEEGGQGNPNLSSAEAAAAHHKMTREERKMEAIMKAFEKLEKREERRNQALNRIERKSSDTRREEKQVEKVEKPPARKEEKKEKQGQKETRSKKKEEGVVAEPQQEVPVAMETESAAEDSVSETTPAEQQPQQPVAKETRTKAKTRRAKRVSSRRRNRAGSGNAISEPSLSVEAADEGVGIPPPTPPVMTNSCPNTPLVTNDSSTMPPSFKFLKTKKHLMNEWLHEKSQDVSAVTATSSPAKTEPLEVNVEDDTMFVTCLPSPRNAMEHLRRNSHSSGTFRPVINMENSIGSAKKRWLRQAMIEKPKSDSGSNSPNTTGGGITSPGMPSPGASPPAGDFVTPLKKRRMARESVDTPQSAGPSSSSPLFSPMVKQAGELEAQSSEVQAQEENKPFSPIYTPSIKMEIPKKRTFMSPRDLQRASIRDSMESEVSDSSVTVSARLSVDQSSDSEHEPNLCPQKVTGSTSGSSIIHSELVSMEDRTSGNDQSLLSDTSHTCEVTNSSEEDHSINSGVQGEVEKLDSTSDSAPCPRGLNIVEEDETVSSGEQQVRPSVEEAEEEEVEVEDPSVSADMEVDQVEVDSTEDQKKQSTTQRSACDSTSRSDSVSSGGSSRADSVNNSVTESSCSTSNEEDLCRPSSMASQSSEGSKALVEPQCVDSSTDTLSSQTVEVSMEVDELPVESHSPQEVSTVEERLVGVDSSVDSSSDQQGSRNSSHGGVSSSSELRLEDSIVESTHLSEGARVSSSALVTSDNSVSENDMVDSSVSDRFEMTVEAEVMNVSDLGQLGVDNTVSSYQGGSFPAIRQFEELSSTSSHEEMGSEVHVDDDSSRSDSITVTTPSEPSASPADSEPTQGTSKTELEAEPTPAKKKVSLLEYRKRLKEKGPSSTSPSYSSSSSSFVPRPSSSSSSSSVPRPSSTSSLSPSVNVHTRLPSLPSLPLFDTSPSKDSSAQNHRQFKSSSDLIRRKSTETPKREKPLSLTERLKKEFGIKEDSEEESGKEDTVPEPPPPPQQPPQQSPGNFKTPMAGAFGGIGGVQPPQIPHSMQGDPPHRLPSPGLLPATAMVPPPPQGPHGGNLMMPPPPPGQMPPLMNHGGPPPQPVPPPGPVPAPANGPQGKHLGQAPTVGKKIPSLMSIPSYHTKGRGGSNHTQGGSNAANLAQPVNGHHEQSHQPFIAKPGLPSHIQQPFSSVAPPANFTHPPPQPGQAPYSSTPPNQQYPPPPQALPQQPYQQQQQQQQQGQHFLPSSTHPNHYQTPPPQAPQTGASGQFVPPSAPSQASYHAGQHQGVTASYNQGGVASYNSYQSASYQQQQQPPNGHQLRGDYNHSYKNSHESEQQSHYNHSPNNYHGSSSHRQKSKKSKHRKSGNSRSYSDYH